MFEKISPAVLDQIDVLDEVLVKWEGEGYYRFVYSDGPHTAPTWYELRSELLADYISALETDATDTHLPSIEYVAESDIETVPMSKWDEFCDDITVRTALIILYVSNYK